MGSKRTIHQHIYSTRTNAEKKFYRPGKYAMMDILILTYLNDNCMFKAKIIIIFWVYNINRGKVYEGSIKQEV